MGQSAKPTTTVAVVPPICLVLSSRRQRILTVLPQYGLWKDHEVPVAGAHKNPGATTSPSIHEGRSGQEYVA